MGVVLSGFEGLLRRAEELLAAQPAAEQAVAMSTSDGGIFGFANRSVTAGSRDDEAEFVKTLAARGNTRITRVVCLWREPRAVDLPSHALRAALLELDGANAGAELLLWGGEGYRVKKLAETI